MEEEAPLILVVDDEAEFREIFTMKLTAVGFRVETAENGQRGVEKAKQLKPALVLMDVRMPVLDGAGAALLLRDDPETRNIPLAFLTSLGDMRTELRAADENFSQSFGATAYFNKTEDLDTLVGKIKGIIHPVN